LLDCLLTRQTFLIHKQQNGEETEPVSLKSKSGFSIGGLTNDLEKATKMFDDVQPVPASSGSALHAPKSVMRPFPYYLVYFV
jgi:hypothetical protein